MALADARLLKHSPEELEFFAEDEGVTIVPYFSLDTESSTLKCIGGDYGPFQPNFPVEVPLWLAIMLNKRKKCRIEAPDWLQSDHLTELLEAERSTAAVFQPLPFRYLEISHLLLKDAKDTFAPDEYYKVKGTVEQIQRLRSNKINAGLQLLSGPDTIKVANLAAMELNTIRPFFHGSLNQFDSLAKMQEKAAEAMTQGTMQTPSQLSSQNLGPARQLRR